MTIEHTCPVCQTDLKAPREFAGRLFRCPSCSAQLTLPKSVEAVEEVVEAEAVESPPHVESNPWDIEFLDDLHGPRRVDHFLEPPDADVDANDSGQRSNWVNSMLAAALDPRSIYWLLSLGGGLMIIGGLIWLISWGALENPVIAAGVLGLISVGSLMVGWGVVLKTRYQIAGRAITFLSCVLLSLNLWFYHVQGLLPLEEGLWIAGVACVLLYAATVWVLRDSLFIYAVEAGVTLTTVLFLGNFGLAVHATHLSVLMTMLALLSIHAHRAFPKNAKTFDRERFGLAFFWCGHAQLAFALSVLLGSQISGSLQSLAFVFNLPEGGIPLTNTRWVPALIWLVGAYAYLYSDLGVRRVGVYMYLAAISLVMAEATAIGFDTLGVEGLIATLAITSTTISLLTVTAPASEERLARAVAPLALVLGLIPMGLGLALHIRATSTVARELGVPYDTTWIYVGVMLLVAVLNRVSAVAYQAKSASLAAVHLFFTAGSLVVAAAGLLRLQGVESWQAQTSWLMWIAIGYIVAARLWRGKSPERPLAWVAHTLTGVILLHVLYGAGTHIILNRATSLHLTLAIVLGEAALFYALAKTFRGEAGNLYAAMATGCAAVWQLMLHIEMPNELFTIMFAVVGLVLLIVGRVLGVRSKTIYNAYGDERTSLEGRGVAALQAGHGVLSISLLVAVVKGLTEVAAVGLKDHALTGVDWVVFGVMTSVAIVGAIVSSKSSWRRVYTVAAIAMGGITFLALNIAVDISVWRKLEVFMVGIGIVTLAASYVGRFREEGESPDDTVSMGLWLGSVLASAPLIVAVFAKWRISGGFSLADEFVLITVTMLMVATGVVWRVKASTLLGGGTLFVYLCVLILSMLYRPQVAIGIYLAGGGALLFTAGIILAVCRERLAAIPERMANREGVFEVIAWR